MSIPFTATPHSGEFPGCCLSVSGPLTHFHFRVLLMDLSQAAFGLDMREASRIYFINPVLNPQVEAQAIGRVRRISQQKPVSVETLVLKNSIDEVILERKKHMSQAEHRQAKSILDIQPIYEWIQNARIVRLPDTDGDGFSEMAQLSTPQTLFGRGFGTTLHPDDGLVPGHGRAQNGQRRGTASPSGRSTRSVSTKRRLDSVETPEGSPGVQDDVARPARRVRFMADPVKD